MDSLTSIQLSEWEAYDRIDPIGTWREDYRMASIQSTLVNIHNMVNKGEHEAAVISNPSDFMPIWDKEERKKLDSQAEEDKKSKSMQTVDQIKNSLLSVFGLKESNYIIQDGKRIRIPKPKR